MIFSGRNALPECRAGWTRHILGGVDALSPPIAARVLGAIAKDRLRQLEDTIAIGWLPLDIHMSVLGALRATLGRHGYQDYCVARISSSLHNPALFAKPARAALRLYGARPFAMFKGVPPSLRYIFRQAGELKVQTTNDGQKLIASYDDFPPRFSEGDAWSVIWIATIEAIAAYAMEGTAIEVRVTTVRDDAARGSFEWHAELAPAASGP
jgi:hypothetical protein